MLYFIGIYT